MLSDWEPVPTLMRATPDVPRAISSSVLLPVGFDSVVLSPTIALRKKFDCATILLL